MLLSRHHLLVFLLCIHQPAAWADSGERAHSRHSLGEQRQVRRNYLNTSSFLISGYAILLEGSPRQVARLSGWLDEIAKIPYGKQTLEAILDSGNQLTIRHSDWALHASGRTLAPVSDNLTNGRGEDVEILFDARIPDQGSHRVFNANKQHIEFTAVQNLFHELAHARHLTNGTWRYADSEGQAIEEENLFRKQLSEKQGATTIHLRAGVEGLQLWYPDSD